MWSWQDGWQLSVAGLYCPLVTGNNAQASSGMLTNRRQ
jgi:hypothetical protein